MRITVREATTEDAALIADLSRQTFYDTFAADNNPADMQKFMNEQFTMESLIDEVGAPGNIFLLAYADEEVAGYARLREKSEPLLNYIPSLEIARIYAITNMIGKGIGKKLMEASIDRARIMQKEIIWLGVWEKNQRAIEFYERFGFEKFAEHDFVLGDDVQKDWLMKKQLS
jgi:ribosomal protein S18 acetylase RimI-like enzyme